MNHLVFSYEQFFEVSYLKFIFHMLLSFIIMKIIIMGILIRPMHFFSFSIMLAGHRLLFLFSLHLFVYIYANINVYIV